MATGALAEGVSANDARDVLWFCSSPELFDLMVRRRKWSLTKFSTFITTTMIATLLAPVSEQTR